MRTIITSKKIAHNQFAFIAQLESAGGGKFGRPGVLRLMRTNKEGLDTFARHARIKNNKRYEQIDAEAVDLRCKGPRSGYARKLKAMTKQLEAIN